MDFEKRVDNARREYSRPTVTKVMLDNSISLVMMTTTPGNPDPRGSVKPASTGDPFESPFGDNSFE